MIAVTNKILYQALKELDILDLKLLDSLYKTAEKEKIHLSDLVVDKDILPADNLARVLADLHQIPFIDLNNIAIDPEALQIIPEVVAKSQQIILFKKDQQGLHLAMNNPENIQIRDFITKKTGLPIIPYMASRFDISNALSLYSKNIKSTFEDIISSNVKQLKSNKLSDPPIIKIVATIIEYAYQNKASDIHIEPVDKHSLVRFRIDGILHDVVKLPLNLHQLIISRIKVLSKLKTDEHMAPQDGKLVHSLENEELDIRVSIVPITDGEKTVLRLLSESSRQFSLTDLGLENESLAKVKQAYLDPHGMILATGPTGSGKTTTLYAILKLLNRREVNIATIEDPVEYDIQGINQIQVNPKTKLTFASGLKSIVRQDPDIILVGEIRDQETAGIAVNSALTGHLVLSTLHTNNAATAFPRLLDMKIEPFLVGSTVNVVIAQRLVRQTCPHCRVSYQLKKEEAKQLSPLAVDKLFQKKTIIRAYRGKGCSSCHHTGYSGRIGIFEVLIVDDQVRQAIIDKKDASQIQDIAIKNGMSTILDDGLNKIKQGQTTLEEVVRVTKD